MKEINKMQKKPLHKEHAKGITEAEFDSVVRTLLKTPPKKKKNTVDFSQDNADIINRETK